MPNEQPRIPLNEMQPLPAPMIPQPRVGSETSEGIEVRKTGIFAIITSLAGALVMMLPELINMLTSVQTIIPSDNKWFKLVGGAITVAALIMKTLTTLGLTKSRTDLKMAHVMADMETVKSGQVETAKVEVAAIKAEAAAAKAPVVEALPHGAVAGTINVDADTVNVKKA